MPAPSSAQRLFIATDRKARIANCEIAGNEGQSNLKPGVWGPNSVDFGPISSMPLAHSPAEAYQVSVSEGQADILGDLKVAYCKRQAATLAGEGPLGPVLRDLDALARKDDARGKEAKEIAAAVRKWVASEMAHVEETAKKQPAAALMAMTRLERRASGLPEEKHLAELMKPLQADRNVRSLAKVLQSINVIKQRGPRPGRTSPAAKAKRLKLSLSAIVADANVSKTVKQEAQDAMGDLPK